MRISFRLNGQPVAIDTAPDRRLLDILRNDLGLTATREGCGEGACGSCLVIVDNLLVNACLMPAFRLQNAQVTTVEGLSGSRLYQELSSALEKAQAFRCGFCSSAVLVAAVDLLSRHPEPSDEEIRQALSGTICRCGNYRAIVEGIQDSRRESPLRDPTLRGPRKRRYARRK
jgi:carbon-monoxide dehydrogenase small subunit